MPYYTCSTPTCSPGVTFSLTSAGQTYCPRCFTAGALSTAAAPMTAPVSQTRVIQDSNAMDAVGAAAVQVDELIAKWDLNSVTTAEAGKTHDCVYKLGTRSKRIDREGPVSGTTGVTHAKFRLQFGKSTYAGVRIKVDETLDAAAIQRAFRESVIAQRYVEVYLG